MSLPITSFPLRPSRETLVVACYKRRDMRLAFHLTKIFLLLQVFAAFAAERAVDADRWLMNSAVFPENLASTPVNTNHFATLHAEVVGGQLQITCAADEAVSDLRIISSADAPGHWPARDWRSRSMHRRGGIWVAELPVDSLDVPLIYFIVARSKAGRVASPMRIVEPRTLGLEQPTRFFWAFVEGFEQELDSWRATDPSGVRTDPSAKNGRAALVVRVPPGRHSVMVETTRLRGWFLEEHGATGIGLWLRVKSGAGAATFTLLANAFSTNQVASRRQQTVTVSPQWTKVVLPFESFPKVPLGEVDLFSIELSAEPGTEFLLDNLFLLGRWRDDF